MLTLERPLACCFELKDLEGCSMRKTTLVEIYAHGISACSVCAPLNMPIKDVEKIVKFFNRKGLKINAADVIKHIKGK